MISNESARCTLLIALNITMCYPLYIEEDILRMANNKRYSERLKKVLIELAKSCSKDKSNRCIICIMNLKINLIFTMVLISIIAPYHTFYESFL